MQKMLQDKKIPEQCNTSVLAALVWERFSHIAAITKNTVNDENIAAIT